MAAPGWITIKIDTNAGEIAQHMKRISDRFGNDVLYQGIKGVANEGKGYLEQSVRTWTNRPEIRVRPSVIGGSWGTGTVAKAEIEVVPAFPFDYVDRGTRAHWITPRRPGGILAFQAGYLAKTHPGSFGSTPGGPFGGMVFVRGPVWVKGIRARNFLKMATHRIEKDIVSRLEALIRKLVR